MSTIHLELLPREQPTREHRDKLEVLTALLNGPSVEPIFRHDVIDFPPDHAIFGWRCCIDDCERPRTWMEGAKMCIQHYKDWLAARAAGSTRADFQRTAAPLTAARAFLGACQICPDRPALTRQMPLCRRHFHHWEYQRDRTGRSFEDWLAEQHPYDGYGTCRTAVCINSAEGPLGLCAGHYANYRAAGRPGGARLPPNWLRWFENRGLPVPVDYDDRAVFLEWCRTARTVRQNGEISLLGLKPMLKAEIQWGLHCHTQRSLRAYWAHGWLRALVHLCRVRDLACLDEVDLDDCSHTDRMITGEILSDLRLVHFTPAESKEAGFIETRHFGRILDQTTTYLDLTAVKVRWLRDLLWDEMAGRLSSVKCPRSRKPFDGLRRGVFELSAFLAIDAPAQGQDPTLLHAEHMQRFVADVRLREREGLPALGLFRNGGQPSIVTEHTRRDVFNYTRKLLVNALESGESARLGLDTAFIAALPNGGPNNKISRNPFTDEVARALANEDNLARLGSEEFDPFDRGYRDIWETIVATGRRCSEVLSLKIDCIGRYNGLPMLWHDQTKVGNFNDGIRIPERIYARLDERRRKTLIRFEHRHARPPTAIEREQLAMFPATSRNPGETRGTAYSAFHRPFKLWVDELDLGRCVPHQARHTLATKLLKHGATLTHIRQYLGQVSERMAEHYTKVAGSELDDILQLIWVAGPGTPSPGELLSTDITVPLDRDKAMTLALDLSRRSTPAEGGFCTFQPVVDGGNCPNKLDCENCDRFVLSGADLLYWRRKREQWHSLAERAPDDATADYLHRVFEPTNRAIVGLEKALAGLGLLDDALALDLRRPQDYFHRVWNVGFLADDLAHATDTEAETP